VRRETGGVRSEARGETGDERREAGGSQIFLKDLCFPLGSTWSVELPMVKQGDEKSGSCWNLNWKRRK